MPRVTVLGAKRHNFNDNGNVITGSKIFYIEETTTEPNAKGLLPITLKGAYELFDKVTQVPGVYDLEFSFKPDAKGQPVITLKDLKFVKPVSQDLVKVS